MLLEQGQVIVLGRFMMGRCEVPAVCPPPVEAGPQMGWKMSGREGSMVEKDLSPQGKGSWLGRKQQDGRS